MSTVYTKTPKGIRESTGKTRHLSGDLSDLLELCKGLFTVEDISAQASPSAKEWFAASIAKLVAEGYLRDVPEATRKNNAAAPDSDDLDSLDFSKAPVVAAKKAEEEDRRRKEEERIRHVAEEKARKEAEEKARLEADKEKTRRAAEEKARHEADKKARREMEEKTRRDAEEKARREAEEKARREAEEKARREMDEKARLEAEKKAKLEEKERTRREAEEKARIEAEEKVRREAEEKARMEAEERAGLEEQERIRREAEEKIRREAEEKVRRESEEKANREAKEKARLEEQERIHREAEEKIRREAEEKARREAEEKVHREAKEKARLEEQERIHREAEEKIRREAEEKARREAEEKARLEAEERARLDAEEKARRDEEDRIRREAEEKVRHEEEEKARRERREKARREEEEKARREAEEKIRREAEEKARIEAEEKARIEAEERARIEAEEKARIEAEEKARIEAEEKVRREAEEKARIEAEEKARIEAEEQVRREAEEKIRREAEEKARRKAEEKARLEAEEKARLEQEERDREAIRERIQLRGEKRRRMILPLVFSLLLPIAATLLLLQFISFDSKRGEFEKAVAEMFGVPVKVGSTRLGVFAGPQWLMNDVTVGTDVQTVKIARVRLGMSWLGVFGAPLRFESIHLEAPRLPAAMALKLLGSAADGTQLKAGEIRVNGLTFDADQKNLPALDIHATFNDGRLTKISGQGESPETGKLSMSMDRQDQWRLTLNATQVRWLVGPLPLVEVTLKGAVTADGMQITEFSAALPTGDLSGSGKLSWQGGWRATTKLEGKRIDAAKLAPAWFQDGSIDGNALLLAESSQLGDLFSRPRLSGSFSIGRGLLTGVDLDKTLQDRGMGEQYRFESLSGEFSTEPGRIDLADLKLAAPGLKATGSLSFDANRNASGRLLVETTSQTVRRSVRLSLSGSLAAPRYQR